MTVADVELYTKATCPYCIRAKRMLEMKNVPFTEISVDRGGDAKSEMVKRANGRSTVPQIFIGGQHIGGCDDLMALEYQGNLDAMLGQARP